MDKLKHYRQLIQEILTKYYNLDLQSPEPNLETMIAFDEVRDQYLWFEIGWEGQHRVRNVTVHIRIHQGKIWIEEDWTENGIAADLIEASIPRSDIVLGFHHPSKRHLTECAIA
ncbi:MAG: XisI protein [Geitlerinemataceae cyanobacterium]